MENAPQITLLREVATGPSSAVFVARMGSAPLGRLVAVKVLRFRAPGDVERMLALRDASRALAVLGHRHLICPEAVAAVGGFPALVSPWVEGVDLLEWMEVLRENGTLIPARVVCEIVRALASALDAAYNRIPLGQVDALGRVHLDLKPTNVIVERDGELKLVDFGAGFTSLAGRQARHAALQKGLIKYMAPERREDQGGGPASDVYALGILAVELLRGRWLRRLRGQNPAHDRHLAEVVATLGDLGTRTSADDATLRTMLLRMCAFDEDARPAAAEIAQTFRVLADRTAGPSLESFAHVHALPYLDPVPTEPDPAFAGLPVRLLEEGASASDLPPPEGFQEQGVVQRRLEGGHDWEETDGGWRQASLDDEDDEITMHPPPRPRDEDRPGVTMVMAPPSREQVTEVEAERLHVAPTVPIGPATAGNARSGPWMIVIGVVAVLGLGSAIAVGLGAAWWWSQAS